MADLIAGSGVAVFKIKICGITNPKDALAAQESGADAVGLNFYSKSLRSLTDAKAERVIEVLNDEITRVGVFVNMATEKINRIASQTKLDYIQLHGNESSAQAAEMSVPVIRAIRIINNDLESAKKEIAEWDVSNVATFLLDAGSNAQFGGTGTQLPWDSLETLRTEKGFVLAGGLNCDNVAQAVKSARPAGVDVASGIEKFPGAKDHEQMKLFINESKAALNGLQ